MRIRFKWLYLFMLLFGIYQDIPGLTEALIFLLVLFALPTFFKMLILFRFMI